MDLLNTPIWINFIRKLRALGLSPHCHEGSEYYVRDGKEVRKVVGQVGLYGVAEGGPFDRVEKQVVCAISPFASRSEVVIAMYSLAAYFSRMPDSSFGADVEPSSRMVRAGNGKSN